MSDEIISDPLVFCNCDVRLTIRDEQEDQSITTSFTSQTIRYSRAKYMKQDCQLNQHHMCLAMGVDSFHIAFFQTQLKDW
jgi:RAB protein geranylgeranyltransferase component A